MKRRRVFRALTIFWMLFIWLQSVLSAALSSMESGFLLALVQHIFPWVTEYMLRKAAHFTEYAILGALLFGAMRAEGRPRLGAFQTALGLLTAMADETIQLFSAGRSGQITDVWIDFAGVVTGALLLLAFYAVYRRTKRFNRK